MLIKAPTYIPADVMRRMTRCQLQVIATQKNTKGKYSANANRAQKILWYQKPRTNFMTGTVAPCSMADKGWSIAENETVDLYEWINGTEKLELYEEETKND